MKSKLITLDRRHTGYGIWKYYVKSPLTQQYKVNKYLFYAWRAWCWETWGPSKEMTEYDIDSILVDDMQNCTNNHWSWQNDKLTKYRIYLKNDDDASMFILKWF